MTGPRLDRERRGAVEVGHAKAEVSRAGVRSAVREGFLEPPRVVDGLEQDTAG